MYLGVEGGWGVPGWWVDFGERDRPRLKKEECFRRFHRTLVHGFLKHTIALGAGIWEPSHCHVTEHSFGSVHGPNQPSCP